MRTPWTPARDTVVRDRYLTDRPSDIAAALGTTTGAVHHRARVLGISKRRHWTTTDCEALRNEWGDLAISELAVKLRRSEAGVYFQACALGLPIGAPRGFEFIAAAARRTGFDHKTMRKILWLARVPMRPSLSDPLPAGTIKCGRIVRRASGWYMCLVIDVPVATIARSGSGAVGVDPGFKILLTLSTGEKIKHPRESEAGALRLAQAQRGGRKRLASRLYERVANRRKDRNHKLSRSLVSRFTEIYFSKDNAKGIARSFGKSVHSAGHSQLRQMLAYKSLASGTRYVEVDSKFSTRTCSSCGRLSGPAGLAGLSVRQWGCPGCGAQHDRDVNAAINTLNAGVGRTLESRAA